MTLEQEQEFIRICEDIHAMIARTGKSMDQSIVICDRIALLLEQNDEWQLQRRHMQLEGPESLSNNPLARLPAVAN